MSRRRDERTPAEEALLGIERQTPEQEAQAEKEQADRIDLRRRFLVAMLQNDMFREWMIEQLDGFKTFDNPFGTSPNGFPDHDATQFALGMKAAGWHLWTLFDEAEPDLASKMRRKVS